MDHFRSQELRRELQMQTDEVAKCQQHVAEIMAERLGVERSITRHGSIPTILTILTMRRYYYCDTTVLILVFLSFLLYTHTYIYIYTHTHVSYRFYRSSSLLLVDISAELLHRLGQVSGAESRGRAAQPHGGATKEPGGRWVILSQHWNITVAWNGCALSWKTQGKKVIV